MNYIKKPYFFIVTCLLLLQTNTNSLNANLVEENLIHSKAFDIAAVYWLPDFQSEMQGSTSGGGSGDVSSSCSEMDPNYQSSIPPKNVCTEFNPGFQLTCYKNCRCKDEYNIATKDCANGKRPNSDKCNNLSNGCEDCPDKAALVNGGWSVSTACNDAERLRTNITSCATYTHCCPDGYLATDYPNRTLKYDINSEKLVAHSSVSSCKKIVTKTCKDFNASYVTAIDKKKNCTKATDTFDLACYTCVDCDAKYNQTDATCKASHAGFNNWTINNDICGEEASSCVCTPQANSCSGYNLSSLSGCSYPSSGKSCANGCQNKYRCDANPCIAQGYKQQTCALHEITNTCYTDSNFKRCTSTCESKLAGLGYQVNVDATNAVITKSLTFSTTNATTLNSVINFAHIPECKYKGYPTITYGSGVKLLIDKNFKSLNIKSVSNVIELSGTDIHDGGLVANDALIRKGQLNIKYSKTTAKKTITANNFLVRGGHLIIHDANINFKNFFVYNGAQSYIESSNFTANNFETTSNSFKGPVFSGSSVIRVKYTSLGAIRQDGGGHRFAQGVNIRINGTSKWYMSAGNVQLRDGAMFCAGNGGQVYFNSWTKGLAHGRDYDGLRVYNGKDVTISLHNDDPSKNSSWDNRGRCY